jgi:hypothetical protein
MSYFRSYEVLTKNEDLLEYSDQTKHLIQVRLPLEYLKRSKVVAYRGDAGKIIAGYCLALKQPFRALQPVPEVLRETIECSIGKILEVNGLWIDSQYRGGFFAIRFWISFLWNLIGTNKRYIIYSYGSQKKALARFYGMANPTKIWAGDVYIEGMDTPDFESVEIASIVSVMIWTVKNVLLKLGFGWTSAATTRSLKNERVKSV